MNKLFKLTFTPLVYSINTINKYKVNVEYFNKHVVGAKFNTKNDKGLGDVIFFTKDFIEVTSTYREGYGGESLSIKSVPDDNCLIEERCIKSYIESINKVKPQLEELCLEKQKSEDCQKKAYKEWQQKKPMEFTF